MCGGQQRKTGFSLFRGCRSAAPRRVAPTQCSVHFVQLERAAPGLRFWYDYRGLLVKMCYSEAYSRKYCYYKNGVGGSGGSGGWCAHSRGHP